MDKFTVLSKSLRTANEQAQRTKGSLELLLSNLASDFDCDSVKDAKKKLKKIQKKQTEAKYEFSQMEDAFEEKWGERLG